MRQAYFRDAKAKYNDIIWWPNGAGWKNQSLTVNTSVRYIYFFRPENLAVPEGIRVVPPSGSCDSALLEGAMVV
jgi:hypothetical protein